MESPNDEEELSEVQKRILAKNKVRQEIADHKTKLRLLKKKYKEGHNVVPKVTLRFSKKS